MSSSSVRSRRTESTVFPFRAIAFFLAMGAAAVAILATV